jgi:hypothetical protein
MPEFEWVGSVGITHSLDPVNQDGEHGLFIGRMVLKCGL